MHGVHFKGQFMQSNQRISPTPLEQIYSSLAQVKKPITSNEVEAFNKIKQLIISHGKKFYPDELNKLEEAIKKTNELFHNSLININTPKNKELKQCNEECQRINKIIECYKLGDKLRLAVWNGNDKKLSNDAGVSTVIIKNDRGETLLHNAVESGHVKAAQILLKNGADFKIQDKEGNTPVHLAAKKGNVEMLSLFLDLDKSVVHLPATSWWTPLHFAVQGGHVNAAKFLIEHHTNPNMRSQCGNTPFHLASRNGDAEMLICLLETSKNLNETKEKVNSQNKAGWTPLHFAVQGGHVKTARILIEKGADPNIESISGKTPIHLACDKEDTNMLLCLLKKDVDPDKQNTNGWAPPEAAKILIANLKEIKTF